MDGYIVNIQRFSIHDGPGIRSTVFLKGCSLHCFWCHNPESIGLKPDLQFYPERCIGCGKCVEACPNGVHAIENGQRVLRRERCQRCGRCLAACPLGAINPDLAATPAAKIDRARCDVCGACAALPVF